MSKKLIKTTSIFVSMTFVSRILGFIRDTVIAQMFGTSPEVDAFYIAQRIPNVLRGFVEGIFSQVFIPILSEYRKNYTHFQVRHFIASTMGIIGCGLTTLTIFNIFISHYWLKIVAPGLDPNRFQLAQSFLKVTFFHLPLISLCALGVAIMNTYGKVWVVAITPMFVNLCLINAALFFSHYFAIPITSQAWGGLAGGFIQFGLLLFFLKRLDLLAWPRLDWRDPGVNKLMKLMLPVLIGVSVNQVGLLINTNLASFLPPGGITWLYYADRLVYFPLSIFGIALSTALSPALAGQHFAGSIQDFNKTLSWGIRLNLLIALPAAVTMAMLAGPLVISLFAYGKFTAVDVIQTRQAVLGYAVGMPAFILARTLITAYYAQQDIRTPIKVVMWVSFVDIVLGVSLVPWLQQGGITLANSLSVWVEVFLLFYWLKQPIKILQPSIGWRHWHISLTLTSAVITVFFYMMTPSIDYWLKWDWFYRFITLSGLGLGALVLFLSTLYLTGFKRRDILTS